MVKTLGCGFWPPRRDTKRLSLLSHSRGAFPGTSCQATIGVVPPGQYVLFSGIRILLVGGRKSITAYAETFDRLLASRGEGHRNRQLRVARFLPTLQAGYQ
jgi:hypothetical protein